MLQALEMEFNGHLEAADNAELSNRLQYFVHVVVVALDGQVMWCHKPNPTQSKNSIRMSASQKCNKEKKLTDQYCGWNDTLFTCKLADFPLVRLHSVWLACTPICSVTSVVEFERAEMPRW